MRRNNILRTKDNRMLKDNKKDLKMFRNILGAETVSKEQDSMKQIRPFLKISN